MAPMRLQGDSSGCLLGWVRVAVGSCFVTRLQLIVT